MSESAVNELSWKSWQEPIKPYPDEPHPDSEFDWKRWWVGRFYRPDALLTVGDIAFMHRCWIETKARWYVGRSKEV